MHGKNSNIMFLPGNKQLSVGEKYLNEKPPLYLQTLSKTHLHQRASRHLPFDCDEASVQLSLCHI